jgi:hypothetical protein
MRLRGVLFLLLLTLIACGDDSSTKLTVNPGTNQDMGQDMAPPDMDAPDAAPDAAPDLVEEDMVVQPDMPMMTGGVMAGVWDLRPAAGGEILVTLTLMHEMGQVPVLGSFAMADGGPSGDIESATYVGNTFSAEWLTGEGQRHLVNMGMINGAEGSANYVSPDSGGIGLPVSLLRRAQ